DVRAALGQRFRFLMVDELEEATVAQRTLLRTLAAENPNQLFALEDDAAAELWFRDLHPAGEVVELERRFRDPRLGFWSCANERAQAQAVARAAEHLVATGTPPEQICVLFA